MAGRSVAGERIPDRNLANTLQAHAVRTIQAAQTVKVNGVDRQIKGFQDSETLVWTVTEAGYLVPSLKGG